MDGIKSRHLPSRVNKLIPGRNKSTWSIFYERVRLKLIFLHLRKLLSYRVHWIAMSVRGPNIHQKSRLSARSAVLTADKPPPAAKKAYSHLQLYKCKNKGIRFINNVKYNDNYNSNYSVIIINDMSWLNCKIIFCFLRAFICICMHLLAWQLPRGLFCTHHRSFYHTICVHFPEVYSIIFLTAEQQVFLCIWQSLEYLYVHTNSISII